MKTANNIKELAYLLRGGRKRIKIGFEDCSDLHCLLRLNYQIDLSSHDISSWDVSNVTDMSNMFYDAEHFNQDISNWDVSNVTDMAFMFSYAVSFNQDLSNWSVGKVNDMRYMFYSAESFNQDISRWDMSKSTDARLMFRHCPIKKNFKPKGIEDLQEQVEEPSKDLQEQVEELSKEVKRLSGIITKLSREAALNNTSMLDAVVANATAKVNEEAIVSKAVELVTERVKAAEKMRQYVEVVGDSFAESLSSPGKWTWQTDLQQHFSKQLTENIRGNWEVLLTPKKRGLK